MTDTVLTVHSTEFEISHGIICLRGATCLPSDGCASELSTREIALRVLV